MTAPGEVDSILSAYRFNLAYASELVADVEEELVYRSFGDGLENHPGFTLGHLVMASSLMVGHLGGEHDVPAGWEELFHRTGPGDPRRPQPGRVGMPSKAELLDTLRKKHAALEDIARSLPAARWQEPASWRFERHFPTSLDLLMFLCVNHEAMHLAQVSAWRRAAGLPSALARL